MKIKSTVLLVAAALALSACTKSENTDAAAADAAAAADQAAAAAGDAATAAGDAAAAARAAAAAAAGVVVVGADHRVRLAAAAAIVLRWRVRAVGARRCRRHCFALSAASSAPALRTADCVVSMLA